MSNDGKLPLVSENSCNPVPVFNCHVILSLPDDKGRITGRVANLDGVTVSASSERDVLRAIAKEFKALVESHSEAGTAIPWREPPASPRDGEVERFIPIHL